MLFCRPLYLEVLELAENSILLQKMGDYLIARIVDNTECIYDNGIIVSFLQHAGVVFRKFLLQD